MRCDVLRLGLTSVVPMTFYLIVRKHREKGNLELLIYIARTNIDLFVEMHLQHKIETKIQKVPRSRFPSFLNACYIELRHLMNKKPFKKYFFIIYIKKNTYKYIMNFTKITITNKA